MAEHRSILKSKGVERVLIIFQDRAMFTHIIKKVPRVRFSQVHDAVLMNIVMLTREYSTAANLRICIKADIR